MVQIARPGEVVHVTFDVTPKDGEPVDRTAEAAFRLVNMEPGDDFTAFTFTLSPDLATQPYHTLTAGAGLRPRPPYVPPTLDPRCSTVR